MHKSEDTPRSLMALAIGVFIGFCCLMPKSLAAHERNVEIQETPGLLFDAQQLVGSYYFGDGLGVNCSLELRKDHTFTFRWSGCLGEYDRNNGTWTLAGDVVVVKAKLPNKREGFAGMGVRFVPIQWGNRVFLADENETPGFVASLRGQVKPNKKSEDSFGARFEERLLTGSTFCQTTAASSVSAQDEPLIPQRFRDYYVFGEVQAKAVHLLPQGLIALDKGSKDRLHPGMLMSVNAFGNVDLQIVSVDEHEAVAKPLYVWNSRRKAKVGDVFTTGNRWAKPHGTGYKWLSAPPEEHPSKSPKK